MNEADDGVGYGRPPRSTRFRPGVSGNPAGRPRRGPTIDDFVRKLLDGPTKINNDGRTVSVSGREAVAFAYFRGALKGDRDALKKVSEVDRQDDREQATEDVLSDEDSEIVEAFAKQQSNDKSDP